MPEIKKQFTGGKMNKDVDERLVPNGEYRDAMNIQVSTSEGSNVGTVQNILGNIEVPLPSSFSPNSTCVGSIADEKNDAFYWFVAANNGYSLIDFTSASPQPFVKKDAIIQHKNNQVIPVFVDIALVAYTIYQAGGSITWDSAAGTITFPSPSSTASLSAGMDLTIDSLMLQGVVNTGIITVTSVVGSIVTVSGDLSWLDANVYGQQSYHQTRLVFASGGGIGTDYRGALNFNPNNIITGINILDDMLFWTDGLTEPKKINIQRSITGTPDTTGATHTKLVVNGVLKGNILEDHITVVKKAPKNRVSMTLITNRDPNLNYSGIFTISDANNLVQSSLWAQRNPLSLSAALPYDLSTFTTEEGNNIVKLIIKSDLNGNSSFSLDGWGVGSKVVIKEVDYSGNIPQIPINDYTIKGVVTEWPWTDANGVTADANTFASSNTFAWAPKLAIKINSISRPPRIATNGTLDFVIDLFDESEKLYEFKLPRFSHRYKYEDGEYSYFAPWTDIAFKPGSFDYHPKKGYNLGMTNTTQAVQLRDFVTDDMPRDVVEIDILYKEEKSPNIYVVDTFKPSDYPTIPSGGSHSNNWDLNQYDISKENIMSILPSNQLLRPYDNVPRNALAQDITGNRLVYGNYIQNYNLDIDGIGYKPHISHELVHDAATLKSIKSLREYQLGVVFTDKYGRETPVLTNDTGTFKVEKNQGTNKNKLQLALKNSASPLDMEFYKFYIKQTSGEYYNMAMDRWYDAEDGNVWVSFNSADRSKINDDTILVLKKGVNSEELVEDPARFKVVAIENEAPDFIKVKKTIISDKAHAEGSVATNIFLTGGDLPEQLSSTFSIAYHDGATHVYSNTVIKDIYDKAQDQGEEFYFQIKNSAGTVSTKPIKIAKINITDEDWVNSSALTKFDIVLEEPFTSLINSFTDDSQGQNSSKILDGNRAVFWSYKKENRAEFDGRFFVKLFQEDTFKEYVMDNTSAETTEYNTLWDQRIYSFDYASHNLAFNGASGSFPGGASSYAVASPTNTPKWEDYMSATDDIALDGSSGYSIDHWKICAAFFRGINVHRAKESVGGQPGFTSHGISERKGFDAMDLHGDPSSWEFEDVWFLDGANSEGQYTSHWNGVPSGTDHQGAGITGNIMELGFGGIQPEKDSDGGWSWNYDSGGGSNDSDFYQLHDNTLYDNDSEGSGLAGRLAPGVIFRWAEDPTGTVYKINNRATHNLVRHETDNLGDDQRDSALGNTGSPYPLYNNIRYHTSTFFRPGNHSKNYALTISQVSDPNNTTMPWNPYTSGEISGGLVLSLTVSAGMSSGGNQVTLNSLTAVDTSGFGYGARTLQVGMVCEELEAVVSKISPNGTTIYFKNYDTNTANPTYAAINNGDTLTFKQYGMNGISRNSAKNINYWNNGKGFSATNVGVDAVGYTIEILEAEVTESMFPRFPAVFETEPTEETGLDIYHEITDNLPIAITKENMSSLIPIGSQVAISAQDPAFGYQDGFTVLAINPHSFSSGSDILIDTYLGGGVAYPLISPVIIGDEVILTTPEGIQFNLLIEGITTQTSGVGTGVVQYLTILKLSPNLVNQKVTPTWFNCYSFGNGVESNRVRDTFNKTYISNGVKVSTTLDVAYKKEHRKHGLIYSGIYNSTSGINNLNQFIAAEKITKDVNPIYGSIQKLYSGWGQGGDLIALCEDRVLKILANKDALYNADGNTNITSTNNVLGQAIPYAGEYGISKNPESFASEAYRAYFTDKVRGTVMRLSMDGLTPISNHGMKDWFRDNLKLSTKLIGSYDDKKDEYNIALENTTESIAKTVSFREDVRGWVSFKSFVPENGISCANEYYTFKNGKLWHHHVESVNRNTFYNSPVANSSVTVLINDMPSSVKSFSTVNYEGSQARVSLSLDANGTIVQDGDYFNLTPLEGWFVDSAFTNLEKGGVSNFIEKEGKWFGFINGDSITSNFFGITTENFDTSDFSIQGIGMLNSTPTVSSASGCTDATAFNYQSAATVDDGSCYAIIYGCMDADADNFIPLISDILVDVNTSDGSCLYYGCTVAGSFNFDPTANSNDGSCVAVVYGCTNPTQFGFNTLANTDDGSCTPFVYGCMDNTTPGGCGPGCDGALNYNSLANTDDGSCTYAVPGCMNFDAWNYNSNATYQPIVVGTCKMCGDATANNYDYPSTYPIPDDYSGCIYCPATTGFTATASATVATEIDLQWDLPLSYLNVVNGGDYMVSVTNVVDGTTVNTSITPGSSGPYLTHTITGLLAGTDYSITIQAECSNTDGPTSSTRYATTIHIIGCMDGTGEFNGVPYAWPACNFNPLATSQTGGVVGYSASDCNYNCAGCMDANYAEFCNTCYTSPVGDFGTVSVNGPYIYDDGSCLTLISYGCTDVQPDIIQNLISYPYYTNFDNSAGVLACCTLCDGSDDNNCCTPTVLGCNDDSTINASSSTVTAATNYDPLANTDDGSCVYPCPTLNQSGANFSSVGAAFSFNKITSLTNLSLTNYSASMLAGGLGLPSAYTATFKVTDNNGTVLYNNINQGGLTIQWHAGAVGGAFWRHELLLDFGTLNVTEDNHNSITCDMEITTNDGNCVVLKSNQYTIGCTDAAASNSGTFDFTDNTQCEYVGCTDSTLNNDGVTYFATNYNNQATVACTDSNGGYSAASSPSQDNACCTYPNLPTSEFKISHAYDMYANAYSDYSSLNVMENTVTDTAYTTAEITQFNVAGALLGWQASWIGGYATSPTSTEAKWLDIPLNGSVDLTTIPNYSTTGIVNHSTIPSNFDNRDLTYSPAYSGNLDNALAYNGLTIDYKVKFTATIINQSRANQIQHIVHNTQTFSGGCKTSTTNVYTAANSNLDPTWQMHIPGSCVLNPVPGCTDPTAVNYNPAATVDDGNCCLTCLAPTAFDVDNPTMVSGFATHVDVTFGDVCEATEYTLYVQAVSVNSYTVTAIQTISAPVGVAATTSVPLYPSLNVSYPANEELTFTIETTCSDGSTSPLATSYLILPA